jgi:hypothetical protein
MRLLLLLLAATPPALAQTTLPRLQDATVVAKNGTISITRLPIQTPHGTIYRDITIELRVDATGHVTLTNAVPPPSPSAPAQMALPAVPSNTPAHQAAVDLPQQASPPVVYQHFTAGLYTAADGSLVQLQNRGMDLIHNVPMWTLKSADGTGAIDELTFYSGPPWLNPRAGLLKRAGITSQDFAYGTSDSGSGRMFGTGALIGVAQDGKTLRVVSFHHGCCANADTPSAELRFTRMGG